MTFPANRLPAVRLWSAGGRVFCRITVPWRDAGGGLTREWALIASPTAPHLRRLTVYRRSPGPPAFPDEPPAAA